MSDCFDGISTAITKGIIGVKNVLVEFVSETETNPKPVYEDNPGVVCFVNEINI